MRGGLGRTLLTAFLVLAIIPLSAISWYATLRERQDIQREVTAKLSAVAALMGTQLCWCTERCTADLALAAASPAIQENVDVLLTDPVDTDPARDALRLQLQTMLSQASLFQRLAVLDSEGNVLVSTDPQVENTQLEPQLDSTAPFSSEGSEATDGGALMLIQAITGQDDETLGLLAGWLNLGDLVADLQAASDLGEMGKIYLVDANGVVLPFSQQREATRLQGQEAIGQGIEFAHAGENREGHSSWTTSTGLYENYAGDSVIGVYHWVPELNLALVAEQAQEDAFAPTENVAAAVVGATLVVALVTAVIAAVVTRQITQPIVRLTESALNIAEGDMEQRVPVKSRDEIGILAYVFNHMTAELKTLYDDLENKVVRRTALLQQANYQIQRRAIQLATTVEVSQASTLILEPGQLLREVVQLIHSSFFAYSFVGIYLLDDTGKRALLREGKGGKEEVMAAKSEPVRVDVALLHLDGIGNGSAVSQAALTGDPHIVRWDAERAQKTFSSPYIRAEAALPLRMGEQIIGVLNILSTEEDDFDADDVSVLQNVANQIAIALENARAYAVEREAADRLRELDRSKRRFLANMSHELRTPLTNILGFSRLMLKEIDASASIKGKRRVASAGSLMEQNRNDLEIIYNNGQHLLGLINDLLDVSQIEAGLMELEFRAVDVADLINSVMATTSALVRDKDIELHQEIAPNLPTVQADQARVRQVLLLLLTNAAKFTLEGSITVRAWSDDGEVLVSISDTGVGILPEDRERIFEQFEQGTILIEGKRSVSLLNGRHPNGAGLGLALSKEFVEMHGGRIWVESEVGQGSTFTFTLPLKPESADDKYVSSAKAGIGMVKRKEEV